MKRWIVALVALLAVVSLIACTPAEPAAEPTEAPAEPTEEPAPELPAVSVSELFEALGMVEAEAYDFVCADGLDRSVEMRERLVRNVRFSSGKHRRICGI